MFTFEQVTVLKNHLVYRLKSHRLTMAKFNLAMIRMTKLEMLGLMVVLFVFCAQAASETRSNSALTFDLNEEIGFFKSDPDGPTVNLPGSEVVLRLCISGSSPPELIRVRFGDGTLYAFPINVTIKLPADKNNPLPVSTKIPNGSGNTSEIPPNGSAALCPTVIRHSYAKPGLYRVEAEVVRPQNFNLTISTAWIRITSLEFLLGEVLIFNQTDRLITFETARFLAAVRDVQLSLVAEVDFGDNSSMKVVELYKTKSVPEWVPNVPWLVDDYRTGTFDHAYAHPGAYTVTLSVWRYQPDKGIEKTEVVTSQRTLTIDTFAQMIGDHLLFYQPQVRTFPRENFELVAMVERLPSENVRVDVDFGDGSPSVSVQLDRTTPRPEWTRLNETDQYYWTLVNHRFSLSGAFQMKMVIWRTDIGESRLVFFCPVVVYDFLVDVKNVLLLLSVVEGQGQNKVTRGESVMFTIPIRSRPEVDLEVLVDFGDRTEQQKINYTTVALASLPYDALYDLPDATHVGFANHIYSTKGTFEATVSVTNVELKRFREATFTAKTVVRVMTCASLAVWIGGSEVQKVYGRWEEIVLDAHVAPGCEDEMGSAGGQLGGGGGGGKGGEGEIRGEAGKEGGDTGVDSEVKEEEAKGAGGKLEEEDEGRRSEGTGEREETGGGGGGDGKEGRKAKGPLAEWRVIRVGPSSVAEMTWMTYPKSSGFVIHFPSYSLPVGEYEFQIQLTRLSQDDSTPLERTVNKTKVIITAMNFKVDVEPETQRIDLSTGSVGVIEATIVPEMDWDDPDQPIVYEWFCVIQKLSDDDLHLIDNPELGCYGDKSKMNGTTSMVGIEPKHFVSTDLPAVYVYARATRSGLTVTSLPAAVWLDANPSDLNIAVVCFINCDQFLSANETLTLSYTCSNCNRTSNLFSQFSATSPFSSESSSSSDTSLSMESTLNFSWTMESSGKGIEIMKLSLTGSTSDWLIIPGPAFYEQLTSESEISHLIKLTVTDRFESQGTASYEVTVSSELKPSFLTRDDEDDTSRASSILVLSQQSRLLFCVTIAGILPQMTSLLRYRT